jgi:hypothetical protein
VMITPTAYDSFREAWKASIPKPYRPKTRTSSRFLGASGDIVCAPPPAEMVGTFLSAYRRAEAREAVYQPPHVSKAQRTETQGERKKRLGRAKQYREAAKAAKRREMAA